MEGIAGRSIEEHDMMRVFLHEGDFEDEYTILKPIEIVLTRSEDFWIADAVSVGAFVPGVGDTITESLETIARQLASELSMTESGAGSSEFADRKNILSSYLSKST